MSREREEKLNLINVPINQLSGGVDLRKAWKSELEIGELNTLVTTAGCGGGTLTTFTHFATAEVKRISMKMDRKTQRIKFSTKNEEEKINLSSHCHPH